MVVSMYLTWDHDSNILPGWDGLKPRDMNWLLFRANSEGQTSQILQAKESTHAPFRSPLLDNIMSLAASSQKFPWRFCWPRQTRSTCKWSGRDASSAWSTGWLRMTWNRVKQYETILNSATGELKLDPSLYLLRVMRGCWAILTRLRTGANTRQTPRRFTRATPQHVRHVAEFRGVGKSQWSPCFRGHWEEDTVMDDVPLRITRTGTSNPEAENSTRWCSLGCSTFSSAIFRGRFPALMNWHWLHVMSAALLLFMPHFVCLLSSEQFLNCSLSVTCSLNFITIYNTI